MKIERTSLNPSPNVSSVMPRQTSKALGACRAVEHPVGFHRGSAEAQPSLDLHCTGHHKPSPSRVGIESPPSSRSDVCTNLLGCTVSP